MIRKSSYVLSYLTEDGKEDVEEFFAYSYEQAKRYAGIFCDQHNYYLIALERTVSFTEVV